LFCAVVCSSPRRALPKIIRRSAVLVDLPKRELHRQVQLGLFRRRAGPLQIEARAALGLDHGDDLRRIGAAGEEVEGVRQDLTGAVGEPHDLEIVARVAGEADALERELFLSALATALRVKAEILAAIAEVDRGRNTGNVTARVRARLQ